MPFATNRGIRIHYEVEGDGPPLVLLHGIAGTLNSWHRLGYVAALRQKYRLILLDARSHGASDKPHAAADYTMANLVGDVTAVLDDLGIDRAHYFGYSMGGRIGFGAAHFAPERFASFIIGGAAPRWDNDATLDLDKRVEALRKGIDVYLAHFVESRFGPTSPGYRADVLANDPKAVIGMLLGLDATPNFETVLPTLSPPCLLFAGTADPRHADVQACASRIPDATFLSLAHLNHLQALNRCDLVLPHVEAFLARVGQVTGAATV